MSTTATTATPTPTLRKRVVSRLQELRPNFGGNQAQWAAKWGINPSSYSTLKSDPTTGGIIDDAKWLDLARQLGITQPWVMVKTEVFARIEEEVTTCQQLSVSLMLVDEPEIGKTFTGEYLSKTLKNCFYVDCSQAKTRMLFVRAFARTLGIDSRGTYAEMKAAIKKQLLALHKPVVILDEAGDVDYNTFLELKEFWNALDGACGWYMMGADGLRTKMERGIDNKKVGYREMFSRYNGKYLFVVPHEPQERQQFYIKLITDVLTPNARNKALIPALVRKCIASDAAGEIGGLRRAATLLRIAENAA